MMEGSPQGQGQGQGQGEGQTPKDPAIVTAERDRAVADAARAVADARAAGAAADKAEREAVAAYVPDFSRVERGSLDLRGDQPLFADTVAQQALRTAAAKLAQHVRAAATVDQMRLLITSDADLAGSDAAYAEVVSGLDELSAAANALLEPPKVEGVARFASAIAIGAQIAASALPGILSLLSAHRTVTTSSATVSDLAAAAAAAGALRAEQPAPPIVHDDIRLLPLGPVHTKLTELSRQRQRLVARRLELAATPAGADDDHAEDTDTDAGTDEQKALVAAIDSLLAAIDAFTAAVRAVPQGSTRSPLTLAALHAQLHAETSTAKLPAFTHVLFVKGAGGSVQQVVEDRPLLFKDRFSLVGTASITYMLLDTRSNELVAADTATGEASVHGTVGEALDASGDWEA
jgi:hypothetical protein